MDKNEDSKYKDFWKNLIKLTKPFHKRIVFLLIIIVFVEVLGMASYYLFKLIVDKISLFDPGEVKALLWLIALVFINERVRFTGMNFAHRFNLKLAVDFEYDYPLKAQEKLLEMPLGYHEDENTGNKLIKVERGINKILMLLNSFAWGAYPTIVKALVAMIALFVVDWRFGTVFAAIAPSFIWMTIRANKKVRPYRKDRYKKYEVASGVMGQSIMNINAVKSFVQEEREHREFKDIKETIRGIEIKEWRTIFNYGYIRAFVMDIGRIGILLLGVYLIYHDVITVGTLVFVHMISDNAFFSMFQLLRAFDSMAEGAEAVNRMMDLLNEEPNIKNKEGAIKPKDIDGQIDFKDVIFTYGKERKKALNKINFRINSGCMTALVGPSGGGKTTVAKLIYRHYDPQKGKILVDDKEISDYNIKSFRKFIAIVPQEVEIFNRTVADNISYARPKVSKTEIEAAAKIANAHEFIKSFKEGYKTLVGERGVKLSGGQRQRIGIARAILANPRILIFDEATSNLDSQSEYLIQDAMDRISKGRTTIVIAHRLSTIKKADKIIVLEDGRVVEKGSHFELAKKKGGLYHKLIKLQEMGEVE